MKKLLSVLPSTLQGGFRGRLLFLALLTTTALWAYDFKSGDLYYNITSDSTVEVTYQEQWPFSNYSGLTTATIPEIVTYNGITYSVTSIGGKAFYKSSSLTSVTIPESVTSIGDFAFYDCSSLTSITIPNSVTSIGNGAFSYCSALTSITIPNSVTSIGSAAFSGCFRRTSIIVEGGNAIYDSRENCNAIIETATNTLIAGCQNTTIPNSVTSIGGYAFAYCSSLTSITIPNSVTSIGDFAFESCSGLTSIAILESVTNIGEGAFYGTSIDYVYVKATTPPMLNIGKYPVFSTSPICYIPCGTLDAYKASKWSSQVKQFVEECEEEDSTNIITYTSSDGKVVQPPRTDVFGAKIVSNEYKDGQGVITFEGPVTSIGDMAFAKCSSITSITIPNSVTSIGNDAFCSCSGLTSITIPNSVTSIGNGAFYDCSALTKTNYTGDIAGWCDIKFGSSYSNPIFYSHNLYINDQEISDLVIPNTVDTIHNYAFYGCSSLTSITIPNSVTSIGKEAFYKCSSLTSITIPKSVTSIGDFAFYGCSGLTSITIPNSVTSIGNDAFYGCSGLTSITCEATTPPTLGYYVFYKVSTSIPVYVPCGCVSAYKAAKYWNDFTNIQEPLADFAIAVNVNNSTMGTAKVDKNTSCGNQISATSNYGYHFVQWSDGVIDNPRTLTLTQDTILTAEFAINQYTISTASSHKERGTTAGDTVVDYLEYVTISATAHYGYHFTQWNDKNTSNPRQIQATQNQNYTAYFNKNTYSISLSCNEVQGEVEGPTYAEYLDKVTLTATANYGYHFTQWSDGVIDNPRTLTLTQDTVLTAEFALTTAGQCGKKLYWVYDSNTSTLTITGSGDMYNERPWGLFVDDLTEVVLPEGLTHIGDDAFVDCINLKAITIPASVISIGANSFAGCRRIRDVYCYPLMPPYAEATSFANYNANLNVPCDFLEDYQYDPVFGSFKYFNCMGAESDNTDSDEVVVTPGTTDVTIVWPTEEDADTYSIVIYKDGRVFCTLTFNANGQLLNIAFAPGRDGNRPAQYAEQVANGYRFTVTGLTESTKYEYNITTKDESDNTISTHSGEFTTKSNTPTDLENNDIQYPISDTRKLLRDGQLYIYHNGSTYTIMGLEIQ